MATTPVPTPAPTTPASSWLWSEVKTHVAYILIIAILLIGAHAWIGEHDARLKAEVSLAANQTTVAQLSDQIKTLTTATQTKIAVLAKRQAQITTPSAAIAAIPSLETLPLGSRPIPSDPTAVAVEAIPLSQELTQLQVTTTQLSGCQDTLKVQQQIDSQKDAEITTLRKKPSFWSRFKSTTRDVAIGIGIGAALIKF